MGDDNSLLDVETVECNGSEKDAYEQLFSDDDQLVGDNSDFDYNSSGGESDDAEPQPKRSRPSSTAARSGEEVAPRTIPQGPQPVGTGSSTIPIATIPPIDDGRLRSAAKTVGPEERQEADNLLQPLPEDYAWVKRLPTNRRIPPWTPFAENSPNASPNHSRKSLVHIFLEMAQEPIKMMIRSWPMLTVHLAIVFVGLIFHFDENPRNNLKSYWSKTKPDKVAVTSGISYRKFRMWYRHLRLYHPSEHSASEKVKNKIYKVELYLEEVQRNLEKMRYPTSRHLSLDEEMAEFKGRSGLIQIIKGKPRGEGLKFYSLCDPKTGYVFSAFLHSGTFIPHQRVWGRIVAIICYKLLSGSPTKNLKSYLDQGFYIYTDRYYSTVHMNYAMSLRQTFFCGTLRREQRSSLPVEIMYGTKRNPAPAVVKNMKRGDILRRYSNYGDTYAITWMDAMPVTYLTSLDDDDDNSTHCKRMGKTASGRPILRNICQPRTSKLFFENMGGVDLQWDSLNGCYKHTMVVFSDQLISSVKKHHKSRRWYVSAVFLQTLDWFVANASILYREQCNPKATNKDAKGDLAEGLLAFGMELCSEGKAKEKAKRKGSEYDVMKAGTQETVPVPLEVEVVKVDRLNRELPHYNRVFTGGRRECQGHMQRVLTQQFCAHCGVFLCITKGCFERFHELDKYLLDDKMMQNSSISRKTQKY